MEKDNILAAILMLLIIIFFIIFSVISLTKRYAPYGKRFEMTYYESIDKYDIRILKDKKSEAKFLIVENSGTFSNGITICPLEAKKKELN